MQRSRLFSKIRRRGRITMACGLAAFDRFATCLLGASDAEAAMRSVDESSEYMFDRKIPVGVTPVDRLRVDYAIWKIGQQQIAIGKLQLELECHRQDCLAFSGAVGEDIKKAGIEIGTLKFKMAAAESQKAADVECHNALASEVEELRTRMGEIEDRFSCRTDLLAHPSQN